jgi:transcriptional regulator with XRE-family HTH domain
MKGNINEGYLLAQRVAIGEILRQNREAKGLTLEQLAEFISLKPNTLAQFEAGNWNPKLSHLTAICLCLGLEINISPLK